MSLVTSIPMPSMVDLPVDEERTDSDNPWMVVLWDDPINTISYVTYVLQKLFGYDREKAALLTAEVDTKGKAAVASDTKEKCELDVFRLHSHGLWATMEQG